MLAQITCLALKREPAEELEGEDEAMEEDELWGRSPHNSYLTRTHLQKKRSDDRGRHLLAPPTSLLVIEIILEEILLNFVQLL